MSSRDRYVVIVDENGVEQARTVMRCVWDEDQPNVVRIVMDDPLTVYAGETMISAGPTWGVVDD